MRASNGKAWIVFEQDAHTGSKTLLSILPPRRTVQQVCEFVEQLYADRHCSIDERIAYKKSRKNATYQAMPDQFATPIHCGHSPFIMALRIERMVVSGSTLHYTFRRPDDGFDPFTNRRFVTRNGSLNIGDPD